LNPASHADRAKLEALLARSGDGKRSWLDRARQVRLPILATGAAAVMLLLAVVLVLARASGRSEAARRPAHPSGVPTALAPAAAPVLPESASKAAAGAEWMPPTAAARRLPSDAAAAPPIMPERAEPDSSISIRRLDDRGAPGAPELRAGIQPAPPSLLDARQ